jgi:3-oxoacyl-[acyl-carrier-protein] synthase-1
MSQSLDIVWCGAVTPVGLDAFQTVAAIRARITGFQQAIPLTPPQEPLKAARIPSRANLRKTPSDWLVNLAARGIRESLAHPLAAGRVALILALPEKVRDHPALTDSHPEGFLLQIESALGRRFQGKYAISEGGAGVAAGFSMARTLLHRGDVDACVVGGVDSLVNPRDIQRIRQTGRMIEPDLPQGLIPGEGSAFLLLTLPGSSPAAVATVFGAAAAVEADSVLGPRFSQGRGFVTALRSAVVEAGIPESSLSFRISSVNGERYAVWESMFSSSRFYRTRRDRLTTWYPASSVGEMGAASGAMTVLVAALAIGGGYAPGPYAMCESSSETGLRAACLIGPAQQSPIPPFRPDEGASRYLLRKLRQAS